MKEFEKLLEELFVKYPSLISDPEFRKLEMAVRAEISRWLDIMESAGIA